MPGTPSTRRRKRARGADADAEGEGEGDEGSPAISSPATKKRPLIAATPTPPKSKKRRRPKAAAAIENKEEEEEDLDNGSPSKKVITPRIVKATTKRKSHYAVRFIDDAEADDLIRDIEKFSKRGRSAQNDDEADEENDSVAVSHALYLIGKFRAYSSFPYRCSASTLVRFIAAATGAS